MIQEQYKYNTRREGDPNTLLERETIINRRTKYTLLKERPEILCPVCGVRSVRKRRGV